MDISALPPSLRRQGSSALVPILCLFLLLAVGAALFLGIRLQKGQLQLAAQLDEAELSRRHMADLQARNQGLEEANLLLHEQLERARFRPILLEEAAEVPPTAAELTPEQQRMLEHGRAFVLGRSDEVESTLSPVEQAALEERARKRREWRQAQDHSRQQQVQNYQQDLQTRQEFFASIPLEGLPANEQQEVRDLVQGLGELRELHAALSAGGQEPAERRAMSSRMRSLKKELPEQMKFQRELLLGDFALQGLGLEREEAVAFLEYMRKLDSLSSEIP